MAIFFDSSSAAGTDITVSGVLILVTMSSNFIFGTGLG